MEQWQRRLYKIVHRKRDILKSRKERIDRINEAFEKITEINRYFIQNGDQYKDDVRLQDGADADGVVREERKKKKRERIEQFNILLQEVDPNIRNSMTALSWISAAISHYDLYNLGLYNSGIRSFEKEGRTYNLPFFVDLGNTMMQGFGGTFDFLNDLVEQINSPAREDDPDVENPYLKIEAEHVFAGSNVFLGFDPRPAPNLPKRLAMRMNAACDETYNHELKDYAASAWLMLRVAKNLNDPAKVEKGRQLAQGLSIMSNEIINLLIEHTPIIQF